MTDHYEVGIPAWVRQLADVCARLDVQQLVNLAVAIEQPGNSAFWSPHRIQDKLGLSTSAAMTVARRLHEISTDSNRTRAEIACTIAALAAQRQLSQERQKDKVEVVCTFPSRMSAPVRSTFAAALEIVDDAQRDIWVVGYVFTRGAVKLVQQIAVGVKQRGIHAKVLGNRMEEYIDCLRSMWPAGVRPPVLYSRPVQSRQQASSMHAKMILCDARVALVTSANFSFHGLSENIEVGLKVESPALSALANFLDALTTTGEVEGLRW